jgi:hypothetical protein
VIHIDVRRSRSTSDILVEVSNDGGPWKQIATFPQTAGELLQRTEPAIEYARAFRDGARYVGAEVRGTAFGYGL